MLTISLILCLTLWERAKLKEIRMRRYRYILLMLLVSLPLFVSAVQSDGIMEKVEHAITAEDWKQAEESFRMAVKENTEEAELFFWKKLQKDVPCHTAMALALGEYYKDEHDFNKAYVFYNELIKLKPDDIGYLSACAEMKVRSGKPDEALPLYERILSLDIDNLAANIFVGNYYYFYAEKERSTIKNNYARLRVPTKMEYARYRESLNNLVNSDYAKAKGYLQRVVSKFPSVEVRKLLNKIRLVETENAQ